jgi:hypothetical protein
VAGGVVAWLTIRTPAAAPRTCRLPVEETPHCGVGGPHLHPEQAGSR